MEQSIPCNTNTKADDNMKIYRYQMTQEFMDEIHNFSKIHQYDERKMFQESWKSWTEENDEIISREIQRLLDLGFAGEREDIIKKMYTSARYYFRKKGIVRKEPCNRYTYINLEKEILKTMDTYINENKNMKPSNGYVSYSQTFSELLNKESIRLNEKEQIDSESINNKLKKTFKNRYYRLVKKTI